MAPLASLSTRGENELGDESPCAGASITGERGTGGHASAPEADSESLAGTHRPPDSLKKKKNAGCCNHSSTACKPESSIPPATAENSC